MRATAAVRAGTVRDVPAEAGGAVAVRRAGSADRAGQAPGAAAAGAEPVVETARPDAGPRQTRRLPGRRVRCRQDAPARLAVARVRRTEDVLHVRGAHQPGRRP